MRRSPCGHLSALGPHERAVLISAARRAIALRAVLADPWAVDTQHHRLALAAVEDRLRQRFPNVDATVVEAAVRISHAELTGQGDGFVPQLVERAAHNRLSYALTEQPSQPAPTSLSQPRTPNVMP